MRVHLWALPGAASLRARIYRRCRPGSRFSTGGLGPIILWDVLSHGNRGGFGGGGFGGGSDGGFGGFGGGGGGFDGGGASGGW